MSIPLCLLPNLPTYSSSVSVEGGCVIPPHDPALYVCVYVCVRECACARSPAPGILFDFGFSFVMRVSSGFPPWFLPMCDYTVRYGTARQSPWVVQALIYELDVYTSSRWGCFSSLASLVGDEHLKQSRGEKG